MAVCRIGRPDLSRCFTWVAAGSRWEALAGVVWPRPGAAGDPVTWWWPWKGSAFAKVPSGYNTNKCSAAVTGSVPCRLAVLGRAGGCPQTTPPLLMEKLPDRAGCGQVVDVCVVYACTWRGGRICWYKPRPISCGLSPPPPSAVLRNPNPTPTSLPTTAPRSLIKLPKQEARAVCITEFPCRCVTSLSTT
ncbi:hypothetical protein E2C01_054675 [Portunus trituberculatus]|uniref:Uncharacterized protein n=1 Tax=Portunus trituberculatus TaxID=210409 RepID=A0A5B7GPA3_PORTR|nr:hypothetical protein [Portunus trituberculatus]